MSAAPTQRKDLYGFPTVLVADLDEALSASLSRKLRDAGYNVLNAPDWKTADEFIKHHSRPIHAVFTNMNRLGSAEALKPYSPELRVLLVSQDSMRDAPDVLNLESAMARIKQIFAGLRRSPSSGVPNRNPLR